MFSVIGVRAQASKTPFFRDLAPDVYWAANELITLLPSAAVAAKRPVQQEGIGPVPTAQGDDWSAPKFGSGFDGPLGGML